MSLKNGIIVLRPAGGIELDEDMRTLIKNHNLVEDMKGLEGNIAEHKIYMNKMLNRLGLRKQEEEEPEPEAKEKPKNGKPLDLQGLAEIVLEIIKILNTHTESLEALSEKIDEISSVQATRPTGRAPVEPTKKDLELIEKRFEEIGLNGEIRKVRPFEFIRGRFIESP